MMTNPKYKDIPRLEGDPIPIEETEVLETTVQYETLEQAELPEHEEEEQEELIPEIRERPEPIHLIEFANNQYEPSRQTSPPSSSTKRAPAVPTPPPQQPPSVRPSSSLLITSEWSEDEDYQSEDDEEEWIGSPIDIKNGRKYYRGLKRNKEEFFLHECAFFRSNSRQPFIGRLMELWEEEDRTKMVRAKWFYRGTSDPCVNPLFMEH